MKKTYFSPELDKVTFVNDDVVLASSAVDLGSGDWGVEDVL